MVYFWYYIVMTLKQLIIMCSIIIAFGIGNNLARNVYDWTWFDSVAPFIPIIILAVGWFVKNQNEHNS